MYAGTILSIRSTATGQAFAAILYSNCILDAMANALDAPADRETLGWRYSESVLRSIVEGVRQHGHAGAKSGPILCDIAFSGMALNREGETAIGITHSWHRDNFPAT
jgi:hypothetical protein